LNYLLPWIIWLLPIVASPFVILVSVANEKACKWFAVAVSAITALIGIYQSFSFTSAFSESVGNWIVVSNSSVSLQVQVDGLSVLLAAFVSFLSFVIVVYAAENMNHEEGQARFYSLVLIFIGAMLGLVMAGNLIQLYFFWEIVGICSALLIAFWTDREAARKAGLKAFVVTRFGDIALFVAVILVLTTLGTTNLGSISTYVQTHALNSTWFLIGALTIVGAMGKSAQVPLHVWLPDAMEGPTPVSALIHAATMVNAGVYLIVRISPIYSVYPSLSTALIVIGLLSMVVGASCACAEQDLKRILAYSTISQLGLMFAAVGLENTAGAIYQLIGQGVFKALAFMAAGSVIEAIGTRNIASMGGLRRVMKYTYLAFLFSMLSMAGLPPLLGFWTKDAILSGALSSNVYAFLIIALASVLTSLYGFRALFRVFHGERKGDAKESRALMIAPMITLVICVVIGWLVLYGQKIFSPSLSVSLNLGSALTTIAVLLIGLGISYYAFVKKIATKNHLIETSPLLHGIITVLGEDFEFDKAYFSLLKWITGPLVRGAKALQTGILENNIAILFAALIITAVLIVIGAI
jgi:NADH-quinone oxidoreductase subunit L